MFPTFRFMCSMILGFTMIAGCGRGGPHFAVVPVKGQVKCDGKPVSGGLIQVAPVGTGATDLPGKTGVGQIGDDGTFVISTFGHGDGAIPGKVRITAGSDDPAKPWNCELSAPIEFEVTASTRILMIEIQPDGSGTVTAVSSLE